MKILIVAFLLTLIEFSHSQSNYFRSVPIPVSIYFSGMALRDNYPSSGFGGELGVSYVHRCGITVNNYLGAGNEELWYAFSAGYTHRLNKIAPYALVGYEFLFIEYLPAYTIELGINFRLTSWLTVKPGIRSNFAKKEYESGSYNLNMLFLSLTIDPFKSLYRI